MESFARRVTDIYISALLLVLPLWTGLGGYADITGSKFRLYAVITIVWAVLLIFAVIKGRMFRAVRGVFPALAAAFALWAAVSTLASPYELTALGRGYDGPAVLCLYALTAAGCCAFGNMRQRYVYLLAVSVTLCCALAFIQLAGFNPLGLYPEGYNYYDGGVWYNGRFLGTMGNTNLLGAFLSLASPLLALNAAGACPRRLCLLLPAAAGCLTIILAGSEAGLLGLLACAAIAIPYYVNRRNRKAAMLALIAEAAALGVFLIFVYFSPPQSGTLRELSELLHGRAEPSFGSHRLEIWAEAARLTAERPILGGGPGSFALRALRARERRHAPHARGQRPLRAAGRALRPRRARPRALAAAARARPATRLQVLRAALARAHLLPRAGAIRNRLLPGASSRLLPPRPRGGGAGRIERTKRNAKGRAPALP